VSPGSANADPITMVANQHTPGDPGPQREERLRGDLAALLAGLPEADQACSVALRASGSADRSV
jgi:hypothetical protein